MLVVTRRWFLSFSLAALSVAAVYIGSIGVYGTAGSEALVVVFGVSLAEWFINTLWAKATGTSKTGQIVLVTFINASASMVTPALYEMIKTSNPDGLSYRIAGNLLYGLGGAFGAYLACIVSKK